MRMPEMNIWLQNQGFEVSRTYNKDRVGYDFTIRKKGAEGIYRNHHDFFPYPEDCSDSVRDRLQRMFLENLVDDFYKAFPELDRNAKPGTDYTKYSFRNGDKICIDKRNTKRMVGCYEGIQNVIFNYPATIVFWTDGTKTVVKVGPDDKWDPEKGLAMAIVKKAYGNKGNYCNEVKRWLPKTAEEFLTQEAYYGLVLGIEDSKSKKLSVVQKACQRIQNAARAAIEDLSK